MIVVFGLLIVVIIYLIYVIFKSYPKDDIDMFNFNIVKNILIPIFRLYYPFKIEVNQNIPLNGPVILAGNHIHLFDQCLAIYCYDRPIHYLAKCEYFANAKTRWFFILMGCIPVNRGIHDKDAVNEAINVLENNYALGIFPEGTRNRTKELLQPFKYGTVSMAQKTNATIIPFAITGHYKFRSKDLKITFGDYFKVQKKDDLTKANNRLYNEILSIIKKNNMV